MSTKKNIEAKKVETVKTVKVSTHKTSLAELQGKGIDAGLVRGETIPENVLSSLPFTGKVNGKAEKAFLFAKNGSARDCQLIGDCVVTRDIDYSDFSEGKVNREFRLSKSAIEKAGMMIVPLSQVGKPNGKIHLAKRGDFSARVVVETPKAIAGIAFTDKGIPFSFEIARKIGDISGERRIQLTGSVIS